MKALLSGRSEASSSTRMDDSAAMKYDPYDCMPSCNSFSGGCQLSWVVSIVQNGWAVKHCEIVALASLVGMAGALVVWLGAISWRRHANERNDFHGNPQKCEATQPNQSGSLKARTTSTTISCPYSKQAMVVPSQESPKGVQKDVLDDRGHPKTSNSRTSQQHPLDLFEDWTRNAEHEASTTLPLAARWLNAGISGHDTPGRLRMGLHRHVFPDGTNTGKPSRHFLVQDDHDWDRHCKELLFKQQCLDLNNRNHGLPLKTLMDNKGYVMTRASTCLAISNDCKSSDTTACMPPQSWTSDDTVWVAELESLDAQTECLELWLDYLPQRYPGVYQYNPPHGTISVATTGQTFYVNEWSHCPLKLCARLVQEDLILLRPSVSDNSTHNPESIASSASRRASQAQYCMAAAAVVHSFDQLDERLGKPMQFIHQPVPGFDQDLLKAVNLTLHTSLKHSNVILWRNNWNFVNSREVPFAHERSCCKEKVAATECINENSSALRSAPEQVDAIHGVAPRTKDRYPLYLEVEYQTLRRLPRSNYILFTVRTMWDPVSELEKVPKAAACLAASIRGRSTAFLKYKGLESPSVCRSLLADLDFMAALSTTNASAASG